MTGFNPSANSVLGVEWPVTVESAYAVDSPTKAAGAAVLSSAADTVDKASMYVAAVADTSVYVMEVWPLATLTEDPDVTTATFRPNEDVVVTTLNRSSGAAGVGTAYPEIDESTLNLADWLTPNAAGVAEWAGRCAVGSGNLTGKQILRVEVHVVAANDDPTADSVLTCYLNISGTKYLAATQHINGTTVTEHTFVWEYNPSTGLPWTIADIELFDVSDEVGFTWADGGAFASYVYQAWMEVDHVPEQRLAFGKATIAATGWAEFNLSAPTGATNFSKANGTEYLFTTRRLSGTGTASFRHLDSGDDCPNGSHGYAVQFSGAEGRLLETGAEFTRAHALIITTTAPATSVDSQPYALRSLAAVYTGHSVESEFTGVAANYGVVRFVVAAQAGVPSADLNVKIRRRSDSTQLGTTMVVAPGDLTGTVTTPREQTVSMTAVALTAVQDYVEFTTTAPDGEGWVVVVLDTTGTGSSASFGGTANAATVGGVEDTDTDAAFNVAQIPDAPGSLVVSVNTASVGPTGDPCPTPIPTHDYAVVSWDQTSLGGSFAYYDLQRNDDGTWHSIAMILTESVTTFNDYEARRGVVASYRVRVFNAVGIGSVYTATVTATCQPYGAVVAFVSNENPALNLAYNDQTPRVYQFGDHPTIVELYDRDGAAAFRHLEKRGDSFVYSLVVGGGTQITPPSIGRQAFQPLLDLINAQLSYVCVLDADGNRWFSACDMTDASRTERGGLYLATVNVRWLTDTPTTPDVAP